MSEHTTLKKFSAWSIFLTFVGISATANYLHGADALAGFLMAMAPIGYAATMAILETIVDKAGWLSKLAIALVATGSGVASYVSLYSLASDHHVHTVNAALLPLAFDGVVLASSLAIRSLSVQAVSKPVQMSKPVSKDLDILSNVLDREIGVSTPVSKPVDSDVQASDQVSKPVQEVVHLAKPGQRIGQADLDRLAKEEDIVSKEMAKLDTELDKALDTDLDMDTASWKWAMQQRADGKKAGEIAEELAKRHSVSTRTIRRSAWWTQAMKGVAPS